MLVLTVLSDIVRDSDAAETEVEPRLVCVIRKMNNVTIRIVNAVVNLTTNELMNKLIDVTLDVIVGLSVLDVLNPPSVLSDAWDG